MNRSAPKFCCHPWRLSLLARIEIHQLAGPLDAGEPLFSFSDAAVAQHVPFQRPPTMGSSATELTEWLALVRRMAGATASLRKALTEAGSARFGETEQLVLWHCYLASEDGLGQSELVTALDCSPAQISGTVERLRQQGQLRSRRSPRDRRRQSWSLTTAGRSTVAEWLEPMSQLLGRFAVGLPANEFAQLDQWLDVIERTADEGSASSAESSCERSAPRQEAA